MGRMQNILGLCFLILFLAGCQSTPHLVKRSQMLMGTVVFVTAVGADEKIAQRAVKAGLDEIRRLEELLSTWISTSELSRVNAAAGRKSIQVSQETFEVLTRSLEVAKLTQGGFNIALGPAVNAWDVSGEGHVPSQEKLEALRPQIELSNVQLDETTRSVWLRRPGMSIDVGGIGKGYAADLAARVMRTAGATAGVVALSGDIKTFGRMPDTQRFVFGIQHPRKEQGQVLGRIELEDEAVSTAGDYQRYFMKDGVRFHHILDPKTLHPAQGCQSVTVIAKDGVMADGLDTGIFVMGPDKGMALIESLPDVEGVIVDREGTVLVSSGLKNRLSLEP
ncbi:FAD:protein FMN transferase [Candidatus Nitrospira neomarina]|uniref:FAD:protein FMN transferase n=1 Tax=Candidatus Nitrospira neomarina TaxID=3020899 RepID=A0AA96GP25_9BACT|nr:FAD:protein FMN transferase [Candidatus Nitrospira neomarina]WNM61699.1 FAD:protein FMN transferase [Candidatus Nitrospira neomarina]